MGLAEDFVVVLAEDFARGFVEVDEGVALCYGRAKEVLECKALNLQTKGRSVLPAGVMNRLLTLDVGTLIGLV